MRQAATALTLILLLLTAPLTAVGLASADSHVVKIDRDHDLTTQASINEFQNDDSTSTTLAYPQTTLTIGKTTDSVDLDGHFVHQYSHEYIRIEYDEDVSRTFRFYVPNDYAAPYSDDDVDIINKDDPNAEVEYSTVENRKYLSVTVSVDGPTDIVVPVDEKTGWSVEFWDSRSDNAKNATGVANEDWERVDSSRLSGANATARVDTTELEDPVFQYQVEEDKWTALPNEPKDNVPVYQFQKQGVEDTVFIVSTVSDPPAVRYQEGGKGGTAKNVARDVSNVVSKISDDIKDVLGGIFG